MTSWNQLSGQGRSGKEYNSPRIETNYLTLGICPEDGQVFKVVRVGDKYILPGGEVVTRDYIDRLIQQNGW